ncbi:HigA family addiction module antitoxin [Aurantimonas sp. E1-2-R+4]|uniref:HigA family addiction module antitoxin n=1 Tax=Aurantimonas sp. E1-2-R+4 TaxID=3113714 RepID=UPI002F94AB76
MALNLSRPIHPGEILREEYLLPLGLTPYALAKAINLSRPRIERLSRETTPVTPDTALRLGRYFGTTPDFWLNLQKSYDLKIASEAKKAEIAAIVPRAIKAA